MKGDITRNAGGEKLKKTGPMAVFPYFSLYILFLLCDNDGL
jgi:hypothetical protein